MFQATTKQQGIANGAPGSSAKRMPGKHLEQRLIRRVHNRISRRRVGVERPGIDRLIRIEWLRILLGFVGVDRTRRVLSGFTGRGFGMGFGAIRPVGPAGFIRPVLRIIFCHGGALPTGKVTLSSEGQRNYVDYGLHPVS